jgi:hypothetical protein
MENQTPNSSTRIVIIIVVVLLIALGAYWAFGRGSSTPPPSTTQIIDNSGIASSTATEEGVGGVTGTGPGIIVDDQNPGHLVVVSQVSLTKPGWVVIHDDNNGVPGNILGARLFDKGKNSGIVELLRALQNGKTYLAVIHEDDGNQHVFSVKTDLPLKDASGTIVMTKFVVNQASDKPQ